MDLTVPLFIEQSGHGYATKGYATIIEVGTSAIKQFNHYTCRPCELAW